MVAAEVMMASIQHHSLMDVPVDAETTAVHRDLEGGAVAKKACLYPVPAEVTVQIETAHIAA